MKVTALNPALRYMDAVQTKKDGQGGGNGSHHGQQQKKESEDSAAEVTDEKVNAAVESFQHDSQTAASGLSASAQGHGPGLKVVLKDRNGTVVRQFTGEEFLKLRHTVTADGRVRGKILDQKF